MNRSYGHLDILLVDDNEDDIVMVKKVFSGMGTRHHLETILNARAALDYLQCRGDYAGRKAVLPDLLLLDINMPSMDGFSLLRILKASPALRKIPVIMLTTSCAQGDIVRSYENGAASFITKPDSFEGFKSLLGRFGDYWLSVPALPQ
ncbi:MAG: response regulator [Elusimicrobia bacterium]|nr:response regulator [Elusimicrobiota bacterium]